MNRYLGRAASRLGISCCLAAVCVVSVHAEPVKIYLMAGQSNMEGWGNWLDGSGAQISSLVDPSDNYPLTQAEVDAYNVPLPRVYVSHPEGDLPTGPLMPGYGAQFSNGTQIGIELSMGHALAAGNTDTFFFYKSDRGGTALGSDWLPPSSAALNGSPVGEQYTRAIRGFHELLADFDNNPLNTGQGYEIAGFVWLQGWNDYFNAGFVADYEQNVLNLAQDVRRDLGIADLPVIISDNPRDVSAAVHNQVATAKANAVNTLNAEMPGSAVYVDSLGVDPNGDGGWFHWNFKASNYIEMGKRNAAGAQSVMRSTPVNHEGAASVAAAWNRFRDTYSRVARYEMEEGSGTAVLNTAGGMSIGDAVLDVATARTSIGLGPGSTGSIDANEGILRANHDFGRNGSNFSFGAWIQLDEDLPDTQATYMVMSGENSPNTGVDSGYNFGVRRTQIDGQWANTLYFDMNKYTGTATDDSLGRDDLLLEEGQAYFVAFVRNHDLTPPGSPSSNDNTVFYLYDPLTDTLHVNDSGRGSRQGALWFLNTRVGIGLANGNEVEDPATRFRGLIDDPQIWDISLSEDDLLALIQQGSLSVAALPGDTDGDGDIDDADLGTSFANYTGPLAPGVGNKTTAQGDADGDGDVDDADLGTSFSGYTGPLGPTTVPEPMSLAMLAVGALGLLRRRR